MKRKLIYILLILQIPLLMQAQYVTLKGKQFYDESGNVFYPVSMNYIMNIVYDATINTSNYYDKYYVSQHSHYGVDNTIDCTNPPTCMCQIDSDFYNIKRMGFNTVHLVGLAPSSKYTDASNNVHTVFNITYLNNGDWWDGIIKKMKNPFSSSDTAANILFTLLDKVIQKAHDIGLKAIIDGQGGDSFDTTNYNEVSFYSSYLAALAEHFNNSSSDIKETILGYILVGEPLDGDASFNRSKQEICQMTSQWYDSLKTHDPNHLVGAGGLTLDEIFKWDPGVMKIDFYFPHFYPYFYYEDGYEPLPSGYRHNMTKTMERINGLLYWYGNNCTVPWMIGETGFSGAPTIVPNDTSTNDGNYAQQTDYVNQTLQQVCNCGGSGYSYWQYQEVWWDADTFSRENCFGLLKHGATDTANLKNIEKPAAAAFYNYANPVPPYTPATQPANYYDPMNTTLYSMNINTVTGTVKDQNGNPIQDALIIGHTYMKVGYDTLGNPYPIDNVNMTFTHDDGAYSITPFDYEDSLNASKQYIRWLQVTASAASNAGANYYDWPGLYHKPLPTSPPQVSNPISFTLNKINANINETVQNLTIYSGQTKSYQARKTLTTENVTVQPNATAEFKAFDAVNVQQEFNAEYGSEVHIYTTPPVFADCNEIGSLLFRTPKPNVPYAENEDVSSSFKLIFKKTSPVEAVNIFPNPSAGMFTINYYGSDDDLKRIIVFDLLGNSIKDITFTGNSTELDLSDFPKGIYYFHLKDKTKTFNKKIIIN
jgi:hypothetical protein